MERAYISSTVEDLAGYRQAVAEALRNCGCDVESMEKYASRDDRPKKACEDDVKKCNIYVGIFAWRYGHVPDDDNPEAKSITELEYLAAGNAQIPRFVFLLDEDFPWTPGLIDSAENGKPAKISELRARLKKETWVSGFRSQDDLAKRVMQTIIQYRSTKKVEILSEMQNLNDTRFFGASYLPNIQAQISQPASEFVAIQLGPTPWWDTRLYLAAALTSDFSEIRQFVFLDAQGRYLTMSSPVEIRRALSNASPILGRLYSESRTQANNILLANPIDRIVAAYPAAVITVFPGYTEEQVKNVVTPTFLRAVGIRGEGEVMDLIGAERWSNSEVVRRRAPYVAVTRNGELEGVIDRLELASQMASQLLRL